MEAALYNTYLQPGSVSLSVGNKGFSSIARPADLIRFGVVITTAPTTDLTAVLSIRPSSGSGAGQFTIATVTSPGAAARAQGSVLFVSIAPPYRFLAGAEFSIDVTVAGTGGVGSFFVDFQFRGFHKRNIQSGYYARLFDSNPAVG